MVAREDRRANGGANAPLGQKRERIAFALLTVAYTAVRMR
jgi:hypothetical protein